MTFCNQFVYAGVLVVKAMIKLDPDVIFIYVQLKVFEHNLSFYCLQVFSPKV